MTYGVPYTQIMQKIRTENIEISKDIYNITKHLTDWLRIKYWKNKQMLALIKELEQSNEESRKEIISQKQDVNKIHWKEKKSDDKTKNRDSKPTGNLRWRQQGFRKQRLEA